MIHLTLVSLDDVKIDKMIIEHYYKLRLANPDMAIIIFIEANMSWLGASHVKRILMPDVTDRDDQLYYQQLMRLTKNRGLDPVWVWNLNPTAKGAPGVITGEQQKVRGADDLATVLIQDNLRMAKEFVSADEKGYYHALREQMQHYRKEIKTPADPIFGKTKIAYTGKSSGRKDDLVISLQLAILWSNVCPRHEQFCAIASANGWPI
jgi:hypothetical protein